MIEDPHIHASIDHNSEADSTAHFATFWNRGHQPTGGTPSAHLSINGRGIGMFQYMDIDEENVLTAETRSSPEIGTTTGRLRSSNRYCILVFRMFKCCNVELMSNCLSRRLKHELVSRYKNKFCWWRDRTNWSHCWRDREIFCLLSECVDCRVVQEST